MDTTELLKKVRSIEIKTKGLTRNVFAGEYHSAFKGRGMAFSEVREYQYGDDIRNIDWNVTARFNHPFVKVFEEERELTVILMVDVSGSKDFGTQQNTKRQLITEIAAVLAFSAITNNDKIGVILFSDIIEKFIPPQKGRQHILYIIRELLAFQPKNLGTNISEALKYLTNAIKKRSTVFLISDFISNDFSDSLRIAAHKHDLLSLRVYDKREEEIPSLGLVYFRDAETGAVKWINTSKKRVREMYAQNAVNASKTIKDIMSRTGVDYITVATNEDYVKPLISLFKSR